MTVSNAVFTRFFDLLLGPFGAMPPMAGLAVLAVVTAVGVLYVFKWTANQAALVRSKRAIQAAVFEMRLFNDDLVALFRAQGAVVRHTLSYLKASLAPTLWLIVPMALLMIHMEFYFGYTGLDVGQPALLRVRFTSDAPVLAEARTSAADRSAPPVRLEAPEGVRVETPAVLLRSEREMAWRIRPVAKGSYQLLLHFSNSTVPKTLLVSDRVGRRSPRRPTSAILDQVLYPSERPVGDGSIGVAEITLGYPEREVTVAGWNIGWIGVYLGLTLAFAFALKRPLGVEM